jgi:hypothetical protein
MSPGCILPYDAHVARTLRRPLYPGPLPPIENLAAWRRCIVTSQFRWLTDIQSVEHIGTTADLERGVSHLDFADRTPKSASRRWLPQSDDPARLNCCQSKSIGETASIAYS